MTTTSELNRLAERVEAATADDQFILLSDAANLLIAPGDFGKRDRFSRFLNAEAYESAAMTLVPEGLFGGVFPAEFGKWLGRLYERTRLGNPVWANIDAYAATPALALTAACLREAASKARADGGGDE